MREQISGIPGAIIDLMNVQVERRRVCALRVHEAEKSFQSIPQLVLALALSVYVCFIVGNEFVFLPRVEDNGAVVSRISIVW